MKEEEAKVDAPQHQMLVYVEKPDGSFGSMQTGSWMVRNHLDDHQEKQRYFHETFLAQLREGRISPIAYFLNRLEISVVDAAARTRFSVRAVKRHQTPKGFRRLRLGELERYAVLFGVPAARLLAITDPFDRRYRLEFQPTALAAVTSLRVSDAPPPPGRPS